MIGEEINCARTECNESFLKKIHNQKYCSKECCKIDTNRKIKEKYHERAAIKKGKERSCRVCHTGLSRYNMSTICNACETKSRMEDTAAVRELMNSVVLL